MPLHGALPGLIDLVAALAAQSYPPERFEVVLVDNGAGIDALRLVRRELWLRCVRESRPGSYAARNRGVAVADGDIVAFTDADCLPAPDWLAAGVAALEAPPPADLVGGRVVVRARDAARPNLVERHQLVQAFPQEHFVRALRFAVTANLFARRRLFEDHGPFEAALFSGGDAEWCQRVAASGATIRYAAAATVIHPAHHRWRSLARQRRRTTGGRHLRARGVGHPPLPLDGVRSSYSRPFARVAHFRDHPLLPSWRAQAGFLAVELFLLAVTRIEQARLRFGGHPVRD